MRTLKFREYIEYRPKRKNSPDYMKYDPNFIGDINETFNHNLESNGTKITYMQYTGVNDKNGKEIYEGDIIKYRLELDDHFQYLLVTFNADKAAFCAGSNSWKAVSRHGEVIGNKFENPELLEKTIEPKMKLYKFIRMNTTKSMITMILCMMRFAVYVISFLTKKPYYFLTLQHLIKSFSKSFSTRLSLENVCY